MNIIERISYIAMSEYELKQAIYNNPRLLRTLQKDCPSLEFIPRLIKAALEVNVDNLRNVITTGHSKIIIESLRVFYHAERDIATILQSDISSKAIDQSILDFVFKFGKTINADRVPLDLLTLSNVMKMVEIDSSQVGYIPDEVFTPEMSLAIFKVDAGAYCCLSNEVSTEDVVAACTTPGHVALLNDEHFLAFYERWKKDDNILGEGFACPSSVGMTVYQYAKLKQLPNTTAAQKATRIGVLRLMKKAMLDIGVKDCWHCANTNRLVEAVKEVFGEALLQVEGLPPHIKREMLSDSLGM
jgi:hypothetical protein